MFDLLLSYKKNQIDAYNQEYNKMQDNNIFNPRKAPKLLKINKALLERRGDDFITEVTEYIIDEKIVINYTTLARFVIAVKLLHK